MDKHGNITISYDTWKNGIQAPIIGMGDMVNVDMFDKPGVLKIDLAPEVLATPTVDSEFITPLYYSGDDNLDLYTQDRVHYSYAIGSGTVALNTPGDSTNRKSAPWADFGIVLDATNNTTINLDASSAAGSGQTDDFVSFTGLTNAQTYNAIHSSPADNDLYIGGGRHIGRLSQVGTFAPGNSGTWNKIEKFLTLPENYVVRDIATVANFLVCSASILGDTVGTIAGTPYGARLYYWDLSQSVSAAVQWTGFVDLSTDIAAPILSANNNIIYYDRAKKTLGATNLSSAQEVFQFNNFTEDLTSYDDCLDLSRRVMVLGLSSDSSTQTPAGIYKIQDGVYTRNTISNDEVGSNGAVKISNVTSILGNDYLVGWSYNSTFGMDHFGKSDYRYASYKAYIESPLYQVSRSLNKKSYQQVEVSLAKPLTTGQGIRISYRKDLSSTWTVMATFDFATYGATSSFNSTAKISDVTTVQIKVELTTGASSTTTPELINVKLF